MFIAVSEESQDNLLRQAKTFCKECEQYANVRFVERVRTVTAYWVLKSSERKYFLICDGCRAQFRVKPHRTEDLQQADIHSLMEISGGRFVPFHAQAMLFLALLCLWLPLLNLGLVWAAWRNRQWFTPTMAKLFRLALWGSVAVNLYILGRLLLEKPYEP